MRWDIFCKVIDNHGDVGVCWRLARQLADEGGDTVRLWIDEPSALQWMAPGGHPGVSVIAWQEPLSPALLAQDAPDVLIEAFGCTPSPQWVAHFAQAAAARDADSRRSPAPARSWINLEYLSAEPVVERLHGLPSPVFHGPGAGRIKHFFYPGFTPSTGGLLRERDLLTQQTAFTPASWLYDHGIAPRPGAQRITLFCYEPPALPDLLAQAAARTPAARLLITPGRAAAAVSAARARLDPRLAIDWLPYLPQPQFDRLLWSADLNFVRGEDSLVRALWAGAPFIWQIYPQHDAAHHAKLDAFLDWLDAPPSLRDAHRAWNGIALDRLHLPDEATLALWRECITAARARLLAQDDLATRLRRFVTEKKL